MVRTRPSQGCNPGSTPGKVTDLLWYNICVKNYTLLLMVSGDAKEKIEQIRLKHTGSKFVDALAPHLTIRGRFELRDGVSEDEVVRIIEKLGLPKVESLPEKMDKIGDACVISINSDEIKRMHIYVLSKLERSTISIRPERERENFHSHITVFRNTNKQITLKDLPDVFSFGQLCLYEMDPSVEKKWVKKITCFDLSLV